METNVVILLRDWKDSLSGKELLLALEEFKKLCPKQECEVSEHRSGVSDDIFTFIHPKDHKFNFVDDEVDIVACEGSDVAGVHLTKNGEWRWKLHKHALGNREDKWYNSATASEILFG